MSAKSASSLAGDIECGGGSRMGTAPIPAGSMATHCSSSAHPATHLLVLWVVASVGDGPLDEQLLTGALHRESVRGGGVAWSVGGLGGTVVKTTDSCILFVYIVQKRARMFERAAVQRKAAALRACPALLLSPASCHCDPTVTDLCVVVDHVDQAVCIQPHIQVAHDHPAREQGRGRQRKGRVFSQSSQKQERSWNSQPAVMSPGTPSCCQPPPSVPPVAAACSPGAGGLAAHPGHRAFHEGSEAEVAHPPLPLRHHLVGSVPHLQGSQWAVRYGQWQHILQGTHSSSAGAC